MLQRLRNYIATIFLTKKEEESAHPAAAYTLLGESRTRLEDYGIIHSVMGESRTNLADYLEEKKETVPPSLPCEEVEVYLLDDWEDFDWDEESAPLVEYTSGSSVSDFDTLERTFASDTPPPGDVHLTAGILGGLEGTTLYEAMRRNDTIRDKVSSLIRGVEAEKDPESSGLADMSRFLETA